MDGGENFHSHMQMSVLFIMQLKKMEQSAKIMEIISIINILYIFINLFKTKIRHNIFTVYFIMYHNLIQNVLQLHKIHQIVPLFSKNNRHCFLEVHELCQMDFAHINAWGEIEDENCALKTYKSPKKS